MSPKMNNKLPYEQKHPKGPITSTFCDGKFTLSREERAMYHITKQPEVRSQDQRVNTSKSK
jgi:hypothetical protein